MPSPGLKFIITTLAAPSGPNTFAMLPPDRWSKVFTTSSPRLMIKHNDVVLYTGTVCLSSQLAVSKGPRQYALLALGNGQTAELKTFWRASNSNPQVARVVSASSLVKAPTDYNKAFLRIMIAEGNITTQDVRDIKSRIDPSSKKGTHWPLPLASFIKEEDLQQQSQRLMSPMTITPQNRSAVFLPMGYGSAKQPLWLPFIFQESSSKRIDAINTILEEACNQFTGCDSVSDEEQSFVAAKKQRGQNATSFTVISISARMGHFEMQTWNAHGYTTCLSDLFFSLFCAIHTYILSP
ncbi:unnamed protein product [Sympodiomycopsis kandeliae]